jgi:hypothetical protein
VQRECSAVAKTRQEWAEPDVDWLPLGKATFKFGIADDDGPSDVREKPSNEPTNDGIVEDTKVSFSQNQLTELLKEQSGARSTEIDQGTASFTFNFIHVGGGASVIGGTPWAILREARAVKIDPKIEAEALFAREGIVRIRDEDAEKYAKQYAAVRRATGLAWRQFMLSAFDRAVWNRSIVLYARSTSVSANFQRIPADAWPLLKVIDWQNGVAVAPDRTIYSAIHVGPSISGDVLLEKSATSTQPTRERAKIILTELYPGGIPKPSIEPNAVLLRKVGKRLKERNMPVVSDATILRAAKRRK